jgi:CheY-like chemotaxis protein
LAFSRKQVLQPVSLNLNQVAVGIEKMLRRILGEDIDIVQVLAPDLGMVRADPGQIEQVLLNLSVNARDAMPDGGKLTIETSNVEVDNEFAERHMAVSSGPYVQLAVTDTGCGMDDQTKLKLFEPFFTTKEMGRGTGLGLSTVYGIVKQSGGFICVDSELGRGSTFKILLPLVCSVSEPPTVKTSKAPQIFGGKETILVVEDEETLRGVARRILDASGYTVLLAANGECALQTSADYAGPIHLLLTDVVMPRMNGRVLAEQLLQTRPEMKVIYMSGYTDDAIVHHGVLDAGAHFINKPVGVAELTRRVREVLDG